MNENLFNYYLFNENSTTIVIYNLFNYNLDSNKSSHIFSSFYTLKFNSD